MSDPDLSGFRRAYSAYSKYKRLKARHEAWGEAGELADEWYRDLVAVNSSEPPRDLIGDGIVTRWLGWLRGTAVEGAVDRSIISLAGYDPTPQYQMVHDEMTLALLGLRKILEGDLSSEYLEVRIELPWCRDREDPPIVSYRLFQHIWWISPASKRFYDQVRAYARVDEPSIHLFENDAVTYTGSYYLTAALIGLINLKKQPARPGAPVIGVHTHPTPDWPAPFLRMAHPAEPFGGREFMFPKVRRGPKGTEVKTYAPWSPGGTVVGAVPMRPQQVCTSACRHCDPGWLRNPGS